MEKTCVGVFFDKFAGVRSVTLIKKETLVQVFSCEHFTNGFFVEHNLWETWGKSSVKFKEISKVKSSNPSKIYRISFTLQGFYP